MNTSLFVGIYHELLRAWPNRWFGFTIAVIATAVIGLVVTILPDQYQTKAKVYINADVVLEPLIQGLAVADDGEKRVRVLRVFQGVLLSRDNVDRLLQTPGLGFDISTQAARKRAFDLISANVKVTEESENLFMLEVVDTDPVRARNVAHGLLSLFVEHYVVDARNELQAARNFLDKQIAEYEIKLKELEQQVANFQLLNVDSLGATSYQARLGAARAALREAQMARQVAIDSRARIQQRLAKNPEATPLLLASDATFPALLDRMNALQVQLNQLLLQYTDKHPSVVAVKREIELLSKQYGLSENLAAAAEPFKRLPGQVPPGSAVDSAVPPLTTSVASAAATGPQQASNTTSPGGSVSAARMQLLQANFAVLDAERKVQAAEAEMKVLAELSNVAPGAEITLDQLKRDYAVLKENYEQLLRRRESARMRAAASMSAGMEQFRVLLAPYVPDAPTSPDRRAFLLLGTLIAVVTAGALAYAMGLLRGTFVSSAEAEAALGLPVIASLNDRHGLLSRFSQTADVLVLSSAIMGLFVAAYAWSAATTLMSPVRTEVYRLLEDSLGLVSHFM